MAEDDKKLPVMDKEAFKQIFKVADRNGDGRLQAGEALAQSETGIALISAMTAMTGENPEVAAFVTAYRAGLGTFCSTPKGKERLNEIISKLNGYNEALLSDPAKAKEIMDTVVDKFDGLAKLAGIEAIPANVKEAMKTSLQNSLAGHKEAYPNGIEQPNAEQVCNSSIPLATVPFKKSTEAGVAPK